VCLCCLPRDPSANRLYRRRLRVEKSFASFIAEKVTVDNVPCGTMFGLRVAENILWCTSYETKRNEKSWQVDEVVRTHTRTSVRQRKFAVHTQLTSGPELLSSVKTAVAVAATSQIRRSGPFYCCTGRPAIDDIVGRKQNRTSTGETAVGKNPVAATRGEESRPSPNEFSKRRSPMSTCRSSEKTHPGYETGFGGDINE